MFNNKTFRLFISSTFNDFREERRILQTKVFPEIKKYCLERGLSFQPIDLRWGVSEEAQLDQKALELCLNEVRSCKLHPAPNFLLMLGDRYGWVPLPYHVEQKEFETLIKLIPENDLNQLHEWYQLDNNQIPPSYVLQERTGDYEDYENWAKTEVELRKVLQTAVNNSSLEEDKRTKYFQSATESEIIEGVFGYKDKTKYQQSIYEENTNIKVLDSVSVFGFFRNVENVQQQLEAAEDINLQNDPTFEDYLPESQNELDKVERVKRTLKGCLDESSTYSTSLSFEELTRVGEEEPKEYQKKFLSKVTQFLKSRADQQLQRLDNIREDEVHSKFVQEAFSCFVGREKVIDDIKNFAFGVNDDNLCLIYAERGFGKTALIARLYSIFNAPEAENIDAVVRFIGLTPNSSVVNSLLYSIVNELYTKFGVVGANEAPIKAYMPDIEYDDVFVDYLQVLSNKIGNKKVVILFDGMDLLGSQELFDWLPKTVPNNIKIILSVLREKSNPANLNMAFNVLKGKVGDARYFCKLKTWNYYDREKYLKCSLKSYGRTLKPDQMQFALTNLERNPSPNNFSMFTKTLLHWRSEHQVPSFEDLEEDGYFSKKITKDSFNVAGEESLEDFINSLTSEFHHHHVLVHRLLWILTFSSKGLTEQLIIDLLSQDDDLITYFEGKHHKLESDERSLPISVWARLISDISPLIKHEYDNGLMLFSLKQKDNVRLFLESQDDPVHDSLVPICNSILSILKAEQDSQTYNIIWGRVYYDLLIALPWAKQSFYEYAENNMGSLIPFLTPLAYREYNQKIWQVIVDYGETRLKEFLSQQNFLQAEKFAIVNFTILSSPSREEIKNSDIRLKETLDYLYLCFASQSRKADRLEESIKIIQTQLELIVDVNGFNELDKAKAFIKVMSSCRLLGTNNESYYSSVSDFYETNIASWLSQVESNPDYLEVVAKAIYIYSSTQYEILQKEYQKLEEDKKLAKLVDLEPLMKTFEAMVHTTNIGFYHSREDYLNNGKNTEVYFDYLVSLCQRVCDLVEYAPIEFETKWNIEFAIEKIRVVLEEIDEENFERYPGFYRLHLKAISAYLRATLLSSKENKFSEAQKVYRLLIQKFSDYRFLTSDKHLYTYLMTGLNWMLRSQTINTESQNYYGELLEIKDLIKPVYAFQVEHERLEIELLNFLVNVTRDLYRLSQVFDRERLEEHEQEMMAIEQVSREVSPTLYLNLPEHDEFIKQEIEYKKQQGIEYQYELLIKPEDKAIYIQDYLFLACAFANGKQGVRDFFDKALSSTEITYTIEKSTLFDALSCFKSYSSCAKPVFSDFFDLEMVEDNHWNAEQILNFASSSNIHYKLDDDVQILVKKLTELGQTHLGFLK